MTNEQRQKLAARIACKCIEEGNCLIYQTTDTGLRIQFAGKVMPVRKAVLIAADAPVIEDVFFGTSCMTKNCVAQDHIRQRTPTQKAQFFAKRGAYSGILKTAKMAATKRAKSKLDDDKVAAIRASDKSSRALSNEYGVAASYITSIKAGNLWKSYGGPFSGLGAR